jgi:hypothetical protein
VNIFEDDLAREKILPAILDLAITLRDDVGAGVNQAVRIVRREAGGDLAAALIVAAALIPVDRPIDRWWLHPTLDHAKAALAARTQAGPCGTRSAFRRHQQRGEAVDDACRLAEREYQRARVRTKKNAA